MKTPTFREQYDKIVGAYLRNELKPLTPCACFIGNLLNKNPNWASARDFKGFDNPVIDFVIDKNGLEVGVFCIKTESCGLYSVEEIISLEKLFLQTISMQWHENACNDEESVFNAMTATLEALRKIHESKGEVIEDYVFEKRQLVNI